ncbi:MAG: putative dual-specificity RNA methyltransferase RlmN [Chlamydiae bacterium]|nr:putative dual-specificity RNA methyltransferase RlmN [Chlamydiota bacterium]
MREFCGLLASELKAYTEEEGSASYRTKQLFDWVYQKGVTDYSAMSNLPKKLREIFEERVRLGILSLEKVEESDDGETTKFLWGFSDGQSVESVLIRSMKRRTVCISSQIGCPARCAFCASGQSGLIRNLTAAEIIEQVVHINAHLLEQGEEVTHIVFMGMGEPLENYEAVVRALKILIDPELFGFSPRKITVSTVGVPKNIKRLMNEELNVNLALSLHAPNQQLRKKIVPYARKFPLEDLLRAARAYAQKSKRDITYEYVMIAGVNDKREHAKELVALLKNEQCCVNLIPYNPVDGINLRRPEREAIEAFRSILTDGGVRSTWRYTKGKDIAAACGQLALKQKNLLNMVPNQYKVTETTVANR